MKEKFGPKEHLQLQDQLLQKLNALAVPQLLEQVKQQWQIGEIQQVGSTELGFSLDPNYTWTALMLSETHPDVTDWREVSGLGLEDFSETIKIEKGFRTNALIIGIVNNTNKEQTNLSPTLYVMSVINDWQPGGVVPYHYKHLAEPYDEHGKFAVDESISTDASLEVITTWLENALNEDALLRKTEEPLPLQAEQGRRLYDAVQLPLLPYLVGKDGPLRRWQHIKDEYRKDN